MQKLISGLLSSGAAVALVMPHQTQSHAKTRRRSSGGWTEAEPMHLDALSDTGARIKVDSPTYRRRGKLVETTNDRGQPFVQTSSYALASAIGIIERAGGKATFETGVKQSFIDGTSEATTST